MIIPITMCAGAPPEFVLLELQGKLFPTAGGEPGFEQRFLGHLKVDDKRLLLQVGGHNIVGSVKDLDRALHVVKRRPDAGDAAFEVLCVVRRKLVFTDRPQPVITAAQLGNAGGAQLAKGARK